MSALIWETTVKTVFFSLVLILLAPMSAMAGGDSSDDGEILTSWSEDRNASALLTGGDGGCVVTSANIFVTRFNGGTGTTTSGKVERIFVLSMTRTNVCTGVLEFSASGNGPVENFFFWDGGRFTVMASVGASLQLTNTVTGAVVPVRIDLAWTANGERTDYRHEDVRNRPDGSWDKEVNFGMNILSQATGSVSDGAFQYALTNDFATVARNTRKTKTLVPN